jgi:hypothetical protein
VEPAVNLLEELAFFGRDSNTRRPELSERRRPPSYARPFVVVLLTGLVACAAASVEAWPFTAWRLFSTPRTDQQRAWAATVVSGAGVERNFPIGRVGSGSRGFLFLMNGFADRTPAERDAICRAWVQEGTSYLGRSPVAVRIYATTRPLEPRVGNRRATPVRTLRWICTDRGAVAA